VRTNVACRYSLLYRTIARSTHRTELNEIEELHHFGLFRVG